MPEALLSLFPNIGLVRSKLYPTCTFSPLPPLLCSSPLLLTNRFGLYLDTKQDKIQFFENYAKENHFDPLQPEHWYLQPTAKIMAFKVHLSLSSFVLPPLTPHPSPLTPHPSPITPHPFSFFFLSFTTERQEDHAVLPGPNIKSFA